MDETQVTPRKVFGSKAVGVHGMTRANDVPTV